MSQYDHAYRPSGFSVMPPVIKNLLIINALVYFALTMPPLHAFLYEWFALWPAGSPEVVPTPRGLARVPDFWPWQLVTTAFLHGGFGHLFFNLFGLWMFGVRLENVWGSRRFGIYYAVCVLGASLLQLAVTSAPYFLGLGTPTPVPTVGASGGVLGVLLAFGLMYPDEPIYLYFFVPIKAKWLVVGLAVLDLYSGVTATNSGVAHFAHLGGMLAGFLLLWYWTGRLPVRPRPHSVY